MNCRRCGEILNENANFCWSCGAAQTDSSSPDTIAVPVVSTTERVTTTVVAPTRSTFDVVSIATGSFGTVTHELVEESSRVGRHDESLIVLDDVSVSRHHAVFTRTASGRVTVRDLNSLNGTYVNGQRVEEAILRSGDEVQIGKFKMIFWGAAS